VVLGRLHDGLFHIADVEMSQLNHVARLQYAFGYLVAIDQNAVTAFQVTNSNALGGRNELGVSTRQERVEVVQLARRIAPHDDRPDEQHFAFASAVGDEELSDDHECTASSARSISAEL